MNKLDWTRGIPALWLTACLLPAFLAAQELPGTDPVPANAAPLPSGAAAPVGESLQTIALGASTLQVPVEDATNPLVVIQTTAGDIIVELFPREAPTTVANFIGLATASKPFLDPLTQVEVLLPYYDGTTFHRVLPGVLVQAGSRSGREDGSPGYRFDDEISASSLGLDRMFVVDGTGTPNPLLAIASESDFQHRVLSPLYRAMGITDADQLELRLPEVDRRVRAMTLQEHYEMLGYRYRNDLQSRAPLRGMLAMANAGPNTNGSQFFITLTDLPTLIGRYTVFGKVRSGLDVAEQIGRGPTDAEQHPYQPVGILAVQPL